MTPLDSIKHRGDQLEQAMFADDDFAGQFCMYAQLWDEQLRRRRTPGSIYIAGEWEVFSQHHYAAIVRAWGAWQVKQHIAHLATEWQDTADDRLDLHERILSFYVHCTSMIDNLKHCSTALRGDILRRDFRESNWRLDWQNVKDERNLDAHDGLRPISDLDGTPVIDKSLLSEERRTWASGSRDPEPIEDWIDDVWKNALRCASSAWSDLLGACPAPPDEPVDPGKPPPGSASGQIG